MRSQIGIGVITPFDFALDRELWRWVPEDVTLHLTRLPYLPNPVTVELAAALGDPYGVRRATRDVLAPGPHAVVYSCSSGSFVDGARGERALVEGMLQAGAPAACTTSGALIRELHAMRARRIALVTPYVPAITERFAGFLAEHGITVTSCVDLGMQGEIWTLREDEIAAAARKVDVTDAEALFIACTNVPTYDLITPLSDELGLPVLSANQVTMAAALKLVGVQPRDAVNVPESRSEPSLTQKSPFAYGSLNDQPLN